MEHHRAIVSLMEELEAVDWYDQRIDATDDPELRAILTHNRDEEKEHAAMALEWLRRRDPELDRFCGSTCSPKDRSPGWKTPWRIPGTALQKMAAAGNGASLGIGSLRDEERSMSHLHRELAPISDDAWNEIENEATRTLRTFLTARQLVDFSGPHGWDYSADSLGRLDRVPGPVDGVEAGIRVVQPLVELRHRFSMSRADLDDIDRGRPDPDLSKVVEAAKRAALAEDHIVFGGFKDAHITGIAEASTVSRPLELDDNYTEYPKLVARAVSSLRETGIDGPYAAALGPQLLDGSDRDHRGRRIPGAGAPPADPRWPGPVGPGGRRSRRPVDPRRRFPAVLR